MAAAPIRVLGTLAGVIAAACVCVLLSQDATRPWVGPLFLIAGGLSLLSLMCGLWSRKSRWGKFAIVVSLILLAALFMRVFEKHGAGAAAKNGRVRFASLLRPR